MVVLALSTTVPAFKQVLLGIEVLVDPFDQIFLHGDLLLLIALSLMGDLVSFLAEGLKVCQKDVRELGDPAARFPQKFDQRANSGLG